MEAEFSLTKSKERSSCIAESDCKGHQNTGDLSCESGTIARCLGSRNTTEVLKEDGFEVR